MLMAAFISCTTWEEILQLIDSQHLPVLLPGNGFLPAVLGDVLEQQTLSGHWQLGCPRFCRVTIISPRGFSLEKSH